MINMDIGMNEIREVDENQIDKKRKYRSLQKYSRSLGKEFFKRFTIIWKPANRFDFNL